MGGTGDHPLRTLLTKQLRSSANRAARIDHVVDQYSRFTSHITDHSEAFSLVMAGSSFIDNREGRIIHLLGKRSSPCHPTDIG